jgi:hypothetical protein
MHTLIYIPVSSADSSLVLISSACTALSNSLKYVPTSSLAKAASSPAFKYTYISTCKYVCNVRVTWLAIVHSATQ